MKSTWYIDALDARSGFAVASQRSGDLLERAQRDIGPTIFVSPPAFTAEFLGSRAVGFGLARLQAQTGLFLGQAEVPFDSLAAVVEFVRRTYLRGSAGDGPGENGGTPPGPKPEPGEPPRRSPERSREHERAEGPGRLATGDDPVVLFTLFASNARGVSQKLQPGMSSPPEAPRSDGRRLISSSTSVDGAYRLARGGYRVAEELVRRRPAPNSDEFLDWLISVHRLTSLLARMGLWRLVAAEHRALSSEVLLDYLDSPHRIDGEWLFCSLIRHGSLEGRCTRT